VRRAAHVYDKTFRQGRWRRCMRPLTCAACTSPACSDLWIEKQERSTR
jgi:hypothetical protein